MTSVRKLMIRVRMRLALLCVVPDESVRSTDVPRQHVFVALAADYGNLGDLAITRAQVSFLEGSFPGAVVEPIPISRTLPVVKRLRRVIRPDDIITLIGGGNTGDMYDDIQYLRELVIKNFPRNRLISFPQTIEFTKTPYGRWSQRRARVVYNGHPDLTVMARDRRSLERALALFPKCQVVLAPDVVLTMDQVSPSEEREGALVALRSDRERGLTDAEHDAVMSAVSHLGTIRHRDTHIGDVRVDGAEARTALDRFWGECRTSRLVVTDRLHGMIFAVITGTPCLALDSQTGKVSQFYVDWLSDHPGVTLLKDVCHTSLQQALQRLLGSSQAPAENLSAEFAERFRLVGSVAPNP